MALSIIAQQSEFDPGMTRGVVVIESDCDGPPFQAAFDELSNLDARRLAQQYAGQIGMGAALINGNVDGPYPVNSDGVPLDAVRDAAGKPLPQTHPLMQPARYQIRVPVHRPMR